MHSKTEGYYLASTIAAVGATTASLAFIVYAALAAKLDGRVFSGRFGDVCADRRKSQYAVAGSLVRRCLAVSCLVFLSEYSLAQFISLFVMTLVTLGGILYFRPYRGRNEYFSSIIGEVGSLVVLSAGCLLNYVKSFSSETRNSLGEAVVYTMAFGTSVIAVGSLYETAKSAVVFLKEMRMKKYSHIVPAKTTRYYL